MILLIDEPTPSIILIVIGADVIVVARIVFFLICPSIIKMVVSIISVWTCI